jgi:hypothetical protein
VRKTVFFVSNFHFFLLIFVAQVSAATHPNLVVSQSDVPQIQARIQAKAAAADAFNRMKSQSWYPGAPGWAQEEGWSRKLVEQSFVGLVDNDSQAINQAKANFLIHTQGVDVYHFSKFNAEVQKYQYGQPCTALVLGYDLLEPHLSALEKSNAQAFFTEWGTGLYQFYSGDTKMVSHNFHTSSIACLGLIGLALDGEVDAASTWSTFATAAFRNFYVNYAFNLGGDYTEGYVYQQYGMSAAVMYLDALRRTKGIDLVAQSNMANLWNFYLSAFGSNDSFPKYGDNSGGPFISGTDLYLLEKSQQQGLKSEYIWLWYRLRGSLAAQNLKPYLFKDFDHLGMVLYFPDVIEKVPTSQAFPPSQLLESVTTGTTQGATDKPGGMVVLRSDWNTSQFSTSLWLNNRWRWQNHQHYDPNSFTLEGYGETLISNLNNRSYDDPLRGKWSQQNTIRIDPNSSNSDAPISPFGTGLASSLGSFTRFFRSDFADVVISDSRYSHANLHTFGLPNGNFSLATTANIVPIEKAFRTVLLVRNLLPMPFYLLFDDFKKVGATEYWWQAYIPNTATQISGQGTLTQPYTYTVGSAIMRMAFLNYPQVQLVRGPQEAGRGDRPLQLKIQNSELELLSVLFPSRAGDPAPQFRQIQTSPVVYEVSLEGQTVQVLFNPSLSSVVYQDVETDAQIAVGKDWTKPSRQLVFHQATYARFGGVDFFRTAQPSTQTVPGAYNHCARSADFNGDGVTSLPDFTLLLPRLGEVVSSTNEKFDLQCDNAIDLKDLSQLFLRWSF